MPATARHPTPARNAFQRAAELIRTELGGVELRPSKHHRSEELEPLRVQGATSTSSK